MQSASANAKLSGDGDGNAGDNSKTNEETASAEDSRSMSSVPSLISVTAATAEACSMNFAHSLAVPAVAAVPLFQSQPCLIPFGTDLMPVFPGVNNTWGSQAAGNSCQFQCFQYNNMGVPTAASEASGNSYSPHTMGNFFGHMPGCYYKDSVFHASLIPVQAVFQNHFFPSALSGPPWSYNFPAALAPEINFVTSSQGSQLTTPSRSPAATTHRSKAVRPSGSSSLSMTLNPDDHKCSSLEPSTDKQELSTLQANKAPSTRLSDLPASFETQTGSSPPNLSKLEVEKEIEEKGLLLLVQKELRNTDVGTLGRIVLPKKDAEANLPPLVTKDGLILRMEDMLFSVNWKFKYRFWPNNRSRMYVMENTGAFVKKHNLQTGDLFIVYKEESSGKFIARGKKVQKTAYADQVEDPIDYGRVKDGDCDHSE